MFAPDKSVRLFVLFACVFSGVIFATTFSGAQVPRVEPGLPDLPAPDWEKIHQEIDKDHFRFLRDQNNALQDLPPVESFDRSDFRERSEP